MSTQRRGFRSLRFEDLETRQMLSAVPHALPYFEDFSGGLPGEADGWEYASTNSGRVQIVNGALRMDDSVRGGSYALNEAILHLDLTDRVNVQLAFDHDSISDENHAYSGGAYAGSVNADLISVSVDGVNWAPLANLQGDSPGASFSLDPAIAAAETAANVFNRSDVRIKFQQYDNYPASSDGRVFDNISVNWLAPVPEIAVFGLGQEIADGDNTPSAADGAAFGTTPVDGGVINRTFTIKNLGTADLALTGGPKVAIGGPHAGDFTVDVAPNSPIAPGGDTTFTITFNPSATGQRTATVSIANNDADEALYDFTIQGTGTAPHSLPIFEDFSGGLPSAGWEFYSTTTGRIQVVNGQLRMDDSVNGGDYALNEAILHMDLTNKVNVYLKLDHDSISDENHGFTGANFTGHTNADLISVSVDGNRWVPVANLQGDSVGATYQLDQAVAAAAAAAGVTDRSDVRIKFQQYDNYPASSDGRAIDNIEVNWVTPVPEIAIFGAGVEITDGDSSPNAVDGTAFGAVATTGTATRTFTIKNLGSANLVLTNNVTIGGANPGDFFVQTPPTSPIAPGGQTTFSITFDPSGPGLRTATVNVASNDANEATYDFAISGSVLTPRNIPLADDFSDGLRGAEWGWEYASTPEGRIDVVNGQLRMDDSVSGGLYSRNEAILHVNLTGKPNVRLVLDHDNIGDEDHSYNGASFTGSVDADLIAISVDGLHWVKLTDLSGDFVGGSFALESALQAAEQAAGSTDRSNVQIKFQQYDNYSANTDGRSFDNIRVAEWNVPNATLQSIAWGGAGQAQMKKQGADTWENDRYTDRGDRAIPVGLSNAVWLDVNGDGDAKDAGEVLEPVAFVRNSQPTLRATLATDSTKTVYVRATSTDNGSPLVFTGSTLASGGMAAVDLTTTQNVGASVLSRDLTLRWEVSGDGVIWEQIATSDNHLFVLYEQSINTVRNSPTAKRVEYATELANGRSTIMTISQAIANDTMSRFSFFNEWYWEDAWNNMYDDADCDTNSHLLSNALSLLGIESEVRYVYARTGNSWQGLWSYTPRAVSLGYVEPFFLWFKAFNYFEGTCYVNDGTTARYYMGGFHGLYRNTAYDVLMYVSGGNSGDRHQAYTWDYDTVVPYPTAPRPNETAANRGLFLL